MDIGQTGKYIHVHLRDHAATLTGTPSRNVALYVRHGMCEPIFQNTKILRQLKGKNVRKIAETHISEGSPCVSANHHFRHTRMKSNRWIAT